ncbi:carbon-nitrogen hydrolase family protein [Micromonospora sp. WMMD1120]|uniref:carbon-nitrogen hydrolase family protein n=1 Tax=Micromonospora sp. WMMD1120 TaxID=3016106 RepID=UPI00241646EA|nr:carbon-nitrogen hydrolase family protein [Micromonospora sp. WMMD1120]MDG4810990.1 carbon-nitrogen hydrolase family protein [Micromonospora sp. WMMD1120]
MPGLRIALANVEIPTSPEDSVTRAEHAVRAAAEAGARIVCFPEAYVPGYPWPPRTRKPVTAEFLAAAHERIARVAGESRIHVVLGTERYVSDKPRLTALVLGPDGDVVGHQDKVQLDPDEDATYEPGAGRRVFDVDGVRFGITICHEGFRYPETVRWAVRNGAQLVFHPHYNEAEPGSFQPTEFADPRNSFHEKAFLCRAAENACYVAAVNCASPGSPTTSAVVGPDGTLLDFQPYGTPGLLVCDIDPTAASPLLAQRLRTTP